MEVKTMAGGAGTQVYMDIPAVRGMASSFGTISDVLKAVAKVLELLANILKTTAFIGMVGGAAIAQFLDMIRPDIEDMAEKCAELDKDLSGSVDAYEQGDAQGATRFY
jgi:hypothetical protein